MAEVEPQCGAIPPAVINPVPCHLEPGHAGQHFSTTGCAGSEIHWSNPTDRERADALLVEAANALHEVYRPAGMLMFWSLRITYLDGKRPCDIYRDGDVALMERLVQRVNALADGAFA